jgi:hypothetical protein
MAVCASAELTSPPAMGQYWNDHPVFISFLWLPIANWSFCNIGHIQVDTNMPLASLYSTGSSIYPALVFEIIRRGSARQARLGELMTFRSGFLDRQEGDSMGVTASWQRAVPSQASKNSRLNPPLEDCYFLFIDV